MNRSGAAIVWLAAMLLSMTAQSGTPAYSADPHEIFESRCALCHGEHAGRFTRESIVLRDGVLQGRNSGAALEPFLASHVGGQDAETVALLTEMFRLQLASGGLFEARCRICHERARDLARLTLVLRNGGLIGRYSGRDIRSFLDRHGRLSAREAETLHALLRWQLETAKPN